MKEVPQKDTPEIGGGYVPTTPGGDCTPLPLPPWEEFPRYPGLPGIPGPEIPTTDPL